MGIIELLTNIGEDKLKVQNLGNSLTGAKKRKGNVTEFSFVSDQLLQAVAVDGTLTALVVWVPAEDLRRAYESLKEKADG